MIPLLLCAQVATAVENLIDSGGFETPTLPAGVVHHPSAGSLGAWQTTTSEFEIWANPTPESLALEGNQHLELDAPVFQSIPTVPNQLYRLSFWHSARPQFDNTLAVAVDSTTVQTFSEQGVSASAFQWKYFATTFVAVGSQTTITFSNTPITLSGNGAHIDNVRVVPVLDTDGDGLADDYEMGYGRYQFIAGNFSWSEAKADAEARGGHLGTITSAQEHEFLRANFSGYANGSIRPWLGATDAAQESVWRWVTGEAWNYTRWGGGLPDDGLSGQDYLWSGIPQVGSANQRWDDYGNAWDSPSYQTGYLLEFGYPTDPNKADTDGDGVDDKIESDLGSDPNDPNAIPAEYAATLAAGTTTVEIVQGPYTWNQAKTDAISRGGRLAVLPTAEVNDRAVTAARASYPDGFWLGASDEEQEGVWRWLDGTLLSYERWRAGEPNNFAGDEDALEVMVGGVGWIDLSQNEPRSYLLEKPSLSLLSLPFSAQGAQWSVDYSTAHDQFSSAKAQTTDGQSTYREYTVTGPAVVDFWWKVSSEELYDTFSYSVNGVNQQTISGEVDWTYRTLTLPAGIHTIRWTYTKDGSDAVGQDAGWLDDFAVYPATATLQVRNGSTVLSGTTTVDFGAADLGSAGFTKTLTFANEGYVPLEVQLSLPQGSPFTFDGGASTYGLLVERGESVGVPIRLATATAGNKSAQLTVSAPASTLAPPSITLTGFVRGPNIGLAQGANSLASGQTFDMGLAPRTVEFTINNNGNTGDLVISSISATGNFQITQQPATTIPPQGSTTFKVLAQSIASGTQTGSISITSNAANVATFSLPLSSKSLTGIAQGITDGSMATSGTGGAVGWDFATTQLPSGQNGQALKTGTTPNNGESALEFTAQTAGVISWSWKVGSQENFDWLLCEVDGQEVAGISTKNGVWQTQVVNVPAGANVRWVYRKDASASAGEDAGYLADVEFRSFAANQSFSQWAQTHGIYDPQQRMPKSGLKAMFGWLGGFGVDQERDDDTHKEWILGGRLTYRFPVSKVADGTQQILYSPDMMSWTARRFSQRVVSEDADRMVIEATAPSGTKGFFKVVGGGDTSGSMISVQGGTLPQSSGLAGTAVANFLIGKTEVTWAEWQKVRGWAVANGYDLSGIGSGSGPNHPVRDVSWYDALKWCNAKSEKEGLQPAYRIGETVYRTGQTEPTVNGNSNGYRLPKEVEWEWAARGGVLSRGYLYSGSNDVNAVAWYTDNSSDGAKEVGTKTANELGIYDMSGNIFELCFEDLYGTYRRARGGAWNFEAEWCTVSKLGFFYPYSVGHYFGFRVARNAD